MFEAAEQTEINAERRGAPMLYFIFCHCQPNELIAWQLVIGDGTHESSRESSQKGPEPIDWAILSFSLVAN